MKKMILICSIVVMMLAGCSADKDNSKEQYQTYENYKEKLIANNGALTYNIPFSYKMEVTSLNDGSYTYMVIVDTPQIVMNHVQMMALDSQSVSKDKMEPTAGIFEEETYSLVPNQVDVDKGYPKGLAVNGVSKTKDFTIFVIVSFNKEDQKNVQTFFTFHVVDGTVVGDEVTYE